MPEFRASHRVTDQRRGFVKNRLDMWIHKIFQNSINSWTPHCENSPRFLFFFFLGGGARNSGIGREVCARNSGNAGGGVLCNAKSETSTVCNCTTRISAEPTEFEQKQCKIARKTPRFLVNSPRHTHPPPYFSKHAEYSTPE